MEQKIGRKLHSEEVIHHKDFNKLNNSLNNLEINDANLHLKFHAQLNREMKNGI